MIIDDVDSKLPFLSGIFEAGWSTGKDLFQTNHRLCGEDLHE